MHPIVEFQQDLNHFSIRKGSSLGVTNCLQTPFRCLTGLQINGNVGDQFHAKANNS
jgi:hypothetical protein